MVIHPHRARVLPPDTHALHPPRCRLRGGATLTRVVSPPAHNLCTLVRQTRTSQHSEARGEKNPARVRGAARNLMKGPPLLPRDDAIHLKVNMVAPLPVRVVAPARHLAVGCDGAAVVRPGGNAQKLAGWGATLIPRIVTPAHEMALTMHRTRVKQPRTNRREGEGDVAVCTHSGAFVRDARASRRNGNLFGVRFIFFGIDVAYRHS
mmetsp:Transcript_7438/g.14471  ORF Transcript_7438/g.14471 Transcript_7438/m.14471 type:complete len:207 (-) Transcript_7438:652-1272(-)